MKSISALLVFLVVTSCSTYDYVVESDYSYDGDFSRYRSFDFIANESFSGTDEEKEIIEKYLKNTLGAWGYDYSPKRPGLIVLYTVFYDDFHFKGYDQPNFQGWLKTNYSDKEVVFKKDTLPDGRIEEVYDSELGRKTEAYQEVRYALREGTVLVSFFDRRKRKTVWQGYASGVFGEDKTKNERILRSAVIRVMDEYKLLAFGSS
ncbi:MAG: DUF4136 domain-containing protein [Cyclobacteriaceae bacterium]